MAQFARRERLFRRTPRVLLGLSGGPDSLACLLVLLKIRQEFGFEVLPAHFDHQLREGSSEEQQRVRALCASLGLECVTGEGDARQAAAQSRAGTRDDQVETILLRLQRGTGIRGLRGMVPAGEVPGSPAMRLLRPLLETGRQDTLAICREAGLEPIQDPSNADARFARNRARQHTLPLLREANPGMDSALLGLAASAREAFALIERQALAVQPGERGLDGSVFLLSALRDLPGEALILVLEREAAFHNLPPAMNRTRVENLRQAMTKGNGEVSFGGLQVEVSAGLVRVGPPHTEPLPFLPVLLNVPGATALPGARVQVSTDPPPATPGQWSAAFDPALARGALRLRPLAPGDRLRTLAGLRSLQDWLVNEKVPRWKRRRLFALADAEAVILLIHGPTPPVPSGDALWYVSATPLPGP